MQWKGSATYYSFHPPGKAAEVQNRIWSYDIPTRGTKFAPIAGYVSFYASAGTRGQEGWKCYVGGEEGQRGEEVVPQDGDVSTTSTKVESDERTDSTLDSSMVDGRLLSIPAR